MSTKRPNIVAVRLRADAAMSSALTPGGRPQLIDAAMRTFDLCDYIEHLEQRLGIICDTGVAPASQLGWEVVEVSA